MTTHWWNTEKLVQRLAQHGVSEAESLRYAMINAVLFTQATYYATWGGGYRGWMLLYEFVVVTIISLVGLSECYKANGGPQGADFLKRLSVISVPIGIKVALGAVLLGWAGYWGFGYVVTPATFRNPAFVWELYSFVFAAFFMFVFYWRIAVHLAAVVRIQRSNPPLNTDAPPIGGAPVS